MDARRDPHETWIGWAQPEGLVITRSALEAAGARVTWPVVELQATLRDLAGEARIVLDPRALARDVLGWPDGLVVAGGEIPASLRVLLDAGQVLAPALALRAAGTPNTPDAPDAFVILVGQAPAGRDLDAASADPRWTATAHQRFERLLRETGVYVGLLSNGKAFRLVHAPRGESAGWITFRLDDLLAPGGRVLLGAFHMLLGAERLLAVDEHARLPALLRASREHQNAVSKALREQVLAALREMLVAFQRADRAAERRLLEGRDADAHAGLVSLLMRMVFVLFAEERGLLPLESELYASSYSLTRLHAQLQADRDLLGGALDQRYGAWARVVALFRLLHDGVRAASGLALPPRRGELFDPDAHPFLEGRPAGSRAARAGPLDLPRISDGTVFRVLDKLLVLHGERLQYRGLDVEHIGSVYEGLMGFEARIARGESLALQPHDAVVCLDDLLAIPGPTRLAALRAEAGLRLDGGAAAAVERAATARELAAALSRRVSPRQPDPIPAGAPFLQPGEERRRLGAHYTARPITQAMVERALRPLLRPDATPAQILALKVCDPAMGSGAFLVEACRQIADHLVRAWERAGAAPALPPEQGFGAEDAVRRPGAPNVEQDLALHARRLVAQQCIYGIDRNPLAVRLARLSLWLVTFAREHPFTFVDHALRHGDALLGVSRAGIQAAAPAADPSDAGRLRLAGDAVLEVLLRAPDERSRARALAALSDEAALAPLAEALRSRHCPFHWEIEFPEVFAPERGGFDAIVGNPPWVSYAGKAAQPLAAELRRWHASASPAFRGFKNLQGLFVHRAAAMLRPGGRLGLVLPTSMSDLAGYEPSRRAHDALCACDDELPDFGDAFEGVFQPSMGLLSTRRAAPIHVVKAGAWPLARSDLDPESAALLDALCALPPLPAHLFGERGFQTIGDDTKHLRPLDAPGGAFTTGVRVGADVEPFHRRAPGLHCDSRAFGGRFRAERDWKAVDVLIRQTARFPIAALSDGAAFRNSILAGFSDATWTAGFLVAWLNSTPVRWFHYMRHRDARQGMPQVKIAHLRALPAPPAPPSVIEALDAAGRALGLRNAGIAAAEQDALDRLACDALSLDDRARARLAAWRASMLREGG